VRFGVLLPHNVPYKDRATLIAWCARIESGPFATLAVGDRVAYDNLDQIVSLSAAAVLTTRPDIFLGVTVLPMHPAALLAKQVASIDVLSQGRVVLGVGVGGRGDDYAAVERPMRDLHQQMDEQIATMRRVWAGESLTDGAAPVGPRPVQPGGPRIYASARGPKSLARAARWADGNFGGSMPLSPASIQVVAERTRAAWHEAGRADGPYLIDAVWFALGPHGEQMVREAGARYFEHIVLRHGFEWTPDMAPCSSEERLTSMIDAYEAAGWHELVFIPCSDELDQLDRLVRFLEAR
jgi:alkanesulfonate monooxygenase SsuD/methylene tetrahydromethanopterin reductase-like flavin-dependent oxidoreductase (luciferase family)